jgi:hypothetical protein
MEIPWRHENRLAARGQLRGGAFENVRDARHKLLDRLETTEGSTWASQHLWMLWISAKLLPGMKDHESNKFHAILICKHTKSSLDENKTHCPSIHWLNIINPRQFRYQKHWEIGISNRHKIRLLESYHIFAECTAYSWPFNWYRMILAA